MQDRWDYNTIVNYINSIINRLINEYCDLDYLWGSDN